MTTFVAIEGIEGTGKTTLAHELARSYANRGIIASLKPEFSSGPASAPLHDALQESLFVSHAFAGGPTASLFYVLFAEAINMQEVDFSADIVIADRHLESVAIYQGHFLNPLSPTRVHTCKSLLESLYRATAIPLADLTIVLHAPISVITQRLEARMRRLLTPIEISTLIAFDDYYRRFSQDDDKYIVLDSSRPISSLTQRVLKEVEERFAELWPRDMSGAYCTKTYS